MGGLSLSHVGRGEVVDPLFDLPWISQLPEASPASLGWRLEPRRPSSLDGFASRLGGGARGCYRGFATAGRTILAIPPAAGSRGASDLPDAPIVVELRLDDRASINRKAPTDAILMVPGTRFTARYFRSELDAQPCREATLYAEDDDSALAFALLGLDPDESLVQIRPELDRELGSRPAP